MTPIRTLKFGAIQPAYLYPAGELNCMDDAYLGDARAIVERFVRPQLAVTFDLLEQAGKQGCSAVTTSEDVCGAGHYIADTTARNVFPELVSLSAPLAEEGLSKIARRYAMVVVGCYNKRIDGRNYNVASVFGRNGEIVGEYRKTHLPPNETWQITPGGALNVIETDFGRVGVAICYDMIFPEAVEALALQGAEVVFHPTAGYGWYDDIGEATLRARANDNSVHIVTAKNYVYNAAGKSSVIDHWGQVRADAGFRPNVVVSADIDLDERKTQPRWYYSTHMSGTADVKERLLHERRPELYGVLSKEMHTGFQPPDEEKQMEIIGKIKGGECRW